MSDRCRDAYGNKIDKFSNLYEDALRKQDRQDKIYSACLETECTFQPDLSRTRYSSQGRAEDTNSTVFNRLANTKSRENSLQRIEAQKAQEEMFDNNTGQPLFHPRVGRAPRGRELAK